MKEFLKRWLWTLVSRVEGLVSRYPRRAAKVGCASWLLIALLLATIYAMAGCMITPIVDTRGVDQNAYQRDLIECRDYAAQAAGPGTGAAVGAALGYALGYALSRSTGGTYNAQAGRGGALLGGAGGAGAGAAHEREVVSNCLRGRGYKVLG